MRQDPEALIFPGGSRLYRRAVSMKVPTAADEVECGPVWVSPVEMCELRIRGTRAPLPATPLKILASLIKAEGRILTRQEIYEIATGRQLNGSRAVDVYMTRIRQALGDLSKYVIGIQGRGYRIDVIGLSRSS
jgi:DNA-binding response OmpR family regulator